MPDLYSITDDTTDVRDASAVVARVRFILLKRPLNTFILAPSDDMNVESSPDAFILVIAMLTIPALISVM